MNPQSLSPDGAVFFEPDDVSPLDPFDPPPSEDADDDVSDAFFPDESPEPADGPPADSPFAELLRGRESVE
jgi:hypothetical protein